MSSSPAVRPIRWPSVAGMLLFSAALALPVAIHALVLIDKGLDVALPVVVAQVVLACAGAASLLVGGPSQRRLLAGACAAVAAEAAATWLVECLPAATKLVACSALSHAAINGALLVIFASTLQPGATPLVTKMGRRINPSFHAGMESYARAVTWAWCGFFVFQMVTSAILAAAAPLRVWSFFVNILDIPLLFAMFAAEGAVRRLRFPNQARVPLSKMIQGVRHGGLPGSKL